MALKKDELAEAMKPIDPPSKAKSTASKPTSTRASSGTRKTSTGTNIADVREGLKGTFTLFGTAISYLDEFDGEIIATKAEAMADALLDVAKTNPAVMRILEGLVSTGAWSGVITVIGMEVALPIAVHHSLLPEPINTFIAQSGDIEVRRNKQSLTVVPDGDIATEQD